MWNLTCIPVYCSKCSLLFQKYVSVWTKPEMNRSCILEFVRLVGLVLFILDRIQTLEKFELRNPFNRVFHFLVIEMFLKINIECNSFSIYIFYFNALLVVSNLPYYSKSFLLKFKLFSL